MVKAMEEESRYVVWMDPLDIEVRLATLEKDLPVRGGKEGSVDVM